MLTVRRWSQRIAPACAAGRDRVFYAFVAIFMTAFGISTLGESLVVGLIGLLLAVAIALMAMSGQCWSDWLSLKSESAQPDEVLGFPYVHGVISLEHSTD